MVGEGLGKELGKEMAKSRRQDKYTPKQLLDQLLKSIEHGEINNAERLIEQGVHLNADYWYEFPAAYAIHFNQPQILALLIRHGTNPRYSDDALFCEATYWKQWDAFKILLTAVFSPDLWRGKTLLDIQKEAHLIYMNIQNETPKYYANVIDYPEMLDEPLHLAQVELVDVAMTCWEHVRPDPPKIDISTIPAKGKPV